MTASDTAFEFGSDHDRDPVASAKKRRASEPHAKYIRVAITCAFFAALLSIGSLIGVESIINAPRRQAEAKSASHRVSHVVYTLPDKTFCRHVSYDNVSGRISEEGTRLCDPQAGSQRDFSWGRK
jgi:hypothetical protein